MSGGNPNHGKDGRFSSGSGGTDSDMQRRYGGSGDPTPVDAKATGHNAGKGNRAVAAHVKVQNSGLGNQPKGKRGVTMAQLGKADKYYKSKGRPGY